MTAHGLSTIGDAWMHAITDLLFIALSAVSVEQIRSLCTINNKTVSTSRPDVTVWHDCTRRSSCLVSLLIQYWPPQWDVPSLYNA